MPYQSRRDYQGDSCIGILIPFGSPNTPVDQAFDARYVPATGEYRGEMLLPLTGIPRTLGQDRPREASQTGKSGMGIATYSVLRQPVETARSTVVMVQPNEIRKGTRMTVSGVVDPYQSVLGRPSERNGLAGLNPRWSP